MPPAGWNASGAAGSSRRSTSTSRRPGWCSWRSGEPSGQRRRWTVSSSCCATTWCRSACSTRGGAGRWRSTASRGVAPPTRWQPICRC
eukprot:378917-Lingulodinium_polyedra.AAC.1